MMNAITALDPISYTAFPERKKIPAAIMVPRPSANATLKSSVRVFSTILPPGAGRLHRERGVLSSRETQGSDGDT
jgi:hypothetical protein